MLVHYLYIFIYYNMINKIVLFCYGIIHILRNHQGGGGVWNDYANVIFALSNAEFDYGRGGGGLETDKK